MKLQNWRTHQFHGVFKLVDGQQSQQPVQVSGFSLRSALSQLNSRANVLILPPAVRMIRTAASLVGPQYLFVAERSLEPLAERGASGKLLPPRTFGLALIGVLQILLQA